MTTTLLFETLHGSRAYNLAREGSDTDLKGVIVGPKAWYFGTRTAPEQVEHSPDHVHYELRKLMRLESQLEAAMEASALPPEPPNAGAIEAWLVKRRLDAIGVRG